MKKLIVLLFLLFAVQVNAATYYLDADNGNDANAGTVGDPWQTLAKAQAEVSDGDTVMLQSGNYGRYAEAISCTFGNTDWITYEAVSGQTPVFTEIYANGLCTPPAYVDWYLRFKGITIHTEDANDQAYAVNMRNLNYVQFIDCTIIGAGYSYANLNAGIFIKALQHVLIDNCVIYGDGPGIGEGTSDGGIPYTDMGKGFDYGVSSDDSSYYQRQNVDVTITDCNIWSCGTGISITDASDWNVSDNELHHLDFDGIYVNWINRELWGTTTPVIIANNHIHTLIEYGEAHADAIQFSGYEINHVIVRGNHIHYMDGDSLYLKGDLNGLPSTDWLIENNLVYDTMRMADSPVYSTVVLLNCSDATFRNNTIIGRVEAALEGTPQTPMTFTVFANNIIKRINLGTDEGSQETIVVYEDNNIIGVTEGYGMGEFVWGDNSLMLYYANDPELNYTIFNALFTDADGNDFTLASDSNAIGFADSNYAPTVDILGVTRDADPDAGCYEDTTSHVPEGGPPTPNPATWDSVPAVAGENAISMTATEGTDDDTPIVYYFDETSGNPGGNDSGWQESTSYTDTGLDGDSIYTYRLQMRDAIGETGVWSDSNSATATDTNAPTPNPATFSVEPAAISAVAISMTASTASDYGTTIEYYFDETTGNSGGTDSGWQSGATYTDTGLLAGTTYTYTVQMRDAVPNTGTASDAASATTDSIKTSTVVQMLRTFFRAQRK